MARRTRRAKPKGRKSKGRGKSKAKKSNQIPLAILEKRLGKLNNIVAKRGGSAY